MPLLYSVLIARGCASSSPPVAPTERSDIRDIIDGGVAAETDRRVRGSSGKPRHSLRDDQWNRIKHLSPGRDEHVGVTAKDNRRSSRPPGRRIVDAPAIMPCPSTADPLATGRGAVQTPAYSADMSLPV
jgi:hypothetical protein